MSSSLLAAMLGIAPSAGILSAQVAGLPVRNAGIGTGIGLAADLGFPNAAMGKGVAIGAIIVAAAEVLAALYIAPQVALAAPFLVLLAALWIRPWGIYGSREELERI